MTTPTTTPRDERIARACAALTDAPAAIDLRDAVLAWRAAGEEAIRAMRGGQ